MTSRKRARGDDRGRRQSEQHLLEAVEDEMFTGPMRANTKTIQLCRQVEEAISSALACSANPLLRDTYVVGVDPLRGTALMRVLVSTEGDNDYRHTVDALARARGYLRGEVAREIHRKRVPTLQIVLLPAPTTGVEAADE